MDEPSSIKTTPAPLEMWGGMECSVVRIESRVEDQLARAGHDRRPDDLDRFAALGLRAFRFPVLWERHAGPAIDWRWTDERLERLRALGVRPIVGFLHHGCGPGETCFLAPDFVDRFAAFARRVAERYPWIDAYTPINEPLTTARFSGMYGLWHPHRRDLASFARILLDECLATRAAMRAIREINPRAQLIQTEDVGKTHSTPRLAYQADLENERRWLSFDLLAGRLDRTSPLFGYLSRGGLVAAEIEAFAADPCPPDVIGMNYYVTSERFLDRHLNRYPPATHGGNEYDRYADVTAVRVREEGIVGFEGLLHEVWQRYHRPIAITEVQLACTREEQLRWLLEAWRAAQRARAACVDVRAITPWSLLGAFDWDSLLIETNGNYEVGAFDVRSSPPRPTAVARAIHSLAMTGDYDHPVLAVEGWWRRRIRLEYPPISAPSGGPGTAVREEDEVKPGAKPLVILAPGTALGRALLRVCHVRGLPCVALPRRELNLADPAHIRETLTQLSPWAVLHAGGYPRIDDAEDDPAACSHENTLSATRLAAACAELDLPLAVFSTDLVFDGATDRPYVETDPANPLSVFGRSKLEMETRVAQHHAGALIVRSSATFGPWDTDNFVTATLDRLAEGPVHIADDTTITATYLPDLVNTTLDLLIDGETGLWHLANSGALTWADLARRLARQAALPVDRVIGVPLQSLGLRAPRPRYSALASERGTLLPPLDHALDRYFVQRGAAWRVPEASRG